MHAAAWKDEVAIDCYTRGSLAFVTAVTTVIMAALYCSMRQNMLEGRTDQRRKTSAGSVVAGL